MLHFGTLWTNVRSVPVWKASALQLRSMLRAIRRRWWMVLAATAAAGAAAAAVTALTVPQYQTSVTFFVTTPNDTVAGFYQGSQYSQARIQSYADLIVGDRLAARIAGQPGTGLTTEQVRSRLSVRLVPDTVLLEATVTDSSANRSQQIADQLSDQFISLVQELETPAGTASPLVTAKVVGGPQLNPEPVSPRPAVNLGFGLLLGLVVGAGGAVLREHLDVTVKSGEQLSEIAGAPLLAVVPADPRTPQSPSAAAKDPHSPRAEAYRHLRTNLRFANVDRSVQVLAVTSPLPGEGKSTTALNLAVAYAEAGQSVLLIEADMRCPNLAEYLGLEGAVGLSDLLAGLVDADDVIQRWGRDRLGFLASGQVPPNPSELVGSAAMAALLEEQRKRFDIIVVDTPPLLPVTDAAALSPCVDGLVLVSRAAKTPQARVAAAMASLRAVDAPLLGCVLNAVRAKEGSGYYAYGYGRQPRKRRRAQAAEPTAQWVGRLRGPATRLAPQGSALDGGGHADLDRPVG